MVLVFRLYATGRISNLDMSNRAERANVFGWFVGMYLLGTVVLYALARRG